MFYVETDVLRFKCSDLSLSLKKNHNTQFFFMFFQHFFVDYANRNKISIKLNIFPIHILCAFERVSTDAPVAFQFLLTAGKFIEYSQFSHLSA